MLTHRTKGGTNMGKPRNGDIRYADGTNWNPGGTGEGIYAYVNGAWAKL